MSRNDREFSTVAEGHYRLADLSQGLILDVKRLRWDRGELVGLLSVAADFAGAQTVDGILSVGTFNLTSPTTRSTRARELATRAKAPEIDFASLLEELCQRVIKAEEKGRPLLILPNVQPLAQDLTDNILVAGFPILRRHPSVLFADGGTGKSTLALYFSGELERRGVSTLYLDWEMDEYDHRDQFGRLFGTDMPDVKYRRCERPLVIEAESIAEQVRECGIDYVVCDSVVFACDGPPEAAEVAARYFRALRQLKVGSLSLAHVTKGEGNDKRPFGSTFWHNSARACWYAEQAEAGPTDDSIHIGLFNRKLTRGRRPSAVGFDIHYVDNNGPITITSADVANDDQLSVKLPLAHRMRHLLRAGALTIAQIADELGAKVDTVEKTAKRNDGRLFTRVAGRDGVYRIGLLDKRSAA